MVWGMNLPDNFGEFWPLGYFEYDPKVQDTGWFSRLTDYYNHQTPAEQKRLYDYPWDDGNAAHFYGGYVADKFIKEIGTEGGAGGIPLTPIQPEEPPRSFETEKNYAALGAMIKMTNRTLAVDENLKALIEQFEPSIHQFFPITVSMPRNKIYPKRYYTLVIGQYFDSFCPAESKEDVWRKDGDFYLFHKKDKASMRGLAFSKAVFNGAHLWRERRFNLILTCFSDALKDAIDLAGLHIPPHYKMREV